MNDNLTANPENLAPALDAAEAAKRQQEAQIDHATHDLVLEAFQTDPRIREALGDHFVDKSSLSPAQVFEQWVTNGGQALAELQQYLALPEAERAAFWETQAPALRQQLIATRDQLSQTETPAATLEDEHRAEAEACFALLEVDCPPELEPQAIDFLAELAPRANLMEQDLSLLSQFVQEEVNRWIVEQRNQTAEQRNQTAEQDSQATTENIGEVFDQVEIIRNSETVTQAEIQNFLSMEQLAIALNSEAATEQQKESLREIVQQFEGINARISSALSTLDPEADPAAYAAAEAIFASASYDWQQPNASAQFTAVLGQINASTELNDEQKDSIARELGVAQINRADTSSGTDLRRSLSAGYGVDTEGNTIPYTEHNPLRMRDGVEVYRDQPGTYLMNLELNGRTLQVRIPENFTAEQMGQASNAILVVHRLERVGLTDLLGRGFEATQGTAIYDVDYDIINRTQQLAPRFVGGVTTLENGQLLSDSQLVEFEENLRWLLPDGDRGAFVRTSRAETRTQMEDTGILFANGDINYNLLDQAQPLIKAANGQEPSLEALRAYAAERGLIDAPAEAGEQGV